MPWRISRLLRRRLEDNSMWFKISQAIRKTLNAPIEGEALAVAWSLEHTKYFTLGCDDLIVVGDHKPLTKILGDRTLDEIANIRLFRLKQRTLPWIFEIYWMPRKGNSFHDILSLLKLWMIMRLADLQQQLIYS